MVLDRRQSVTFGAPLGHSVSAISSCQRQSQVVRLFWWLRIASIRPATSCLRQSLRCPSSPIVAIEVVARQFCHVIVLTVALAGGCVPNFIGAAVTCASINKAAPDAPQGQVLEPSTGRRNVSHSLYATGIWDNEAAPRARCRVLVCIGQTCPCGIGGGAIKLSHRWVPTA